MNGDRRTFTVTLTVRVTDQQLLIDAARSREHLANIDLVEAQEIVPDDDMAAAFCALFYPLPKLPGCEIVSIASGPSSA